VGPLPAITISFPEILARLMPGSVVWINDGKIRSRVVEALEGGWTLEVVAAKAKGEKLHPAKGVNMPDVELGLAPLSMKRGPRLRRGLRIVRPSPSPASAPARRVTIQPIWLGANAFMRVRRTRVARLHRQSHVAMPISSTRQIPCCRALGRGM
jgi:hypothetical protein